MNKTRRNRCGRPAARALRTTAMVGTLAAAAACSTDTSAGAAGAMGGAPAPARATTPAANAASARAATTLATYVGEYDGATGRLTLAPAASGPDGQAVQPLVLGTLPAGMSGAAGATAAGSNTVLLHQTGTRLVDGGCNTLASGDGDVVPNSFQGVCVTVQAISGYGAQEIVRTYVELASLTNSSAAYPGAISTYVSAPPDSDFGVTNAAGGLFGYGRLAQAGVTGVRAAGGATVPLDAASRNWYFQTPGPGAMASFRFVAVVKGELVNPIARPAPAVAATDCLPDTGSRPVISGDGRYVVYATSTPACVGSGVRQVYRFDAQTNTNTLVSHAAADASSGAEGDNAAPTVSDDGRFVAWVSTATNLLPGGVDALGYADANGALKDVFLRDLATDAVYVVSADDATGATPAAASANPSISPDGSFVVFDTTAAIDANGSDANALGDVYRRDVFNALTELVSPDVPGRTLGAFRGSVANLGTPVVFDSSDPAFDGEGASTTSDVFLRDMTAGTTTRVSTTSGGASAAGDAQNGVVSSDGRVVAFDSDATDMLGAATTAGRTHVYVRNSDLSGLARADVGVGADGGVLEASASASRPALSASGRLVVFVSQATNLDPLATSGNADVFMFDVRATDPRRQRSYVVDASRSNAVAAAGVAAVGAAIGRSSGDYAVFVSDDASLVSPVAGAGSRLYVAPLR